MLWKNLGPASPRPTGYVGADLGAGEPVDLGNGYAWTPMGATGRGCVTRAGAAYSEDPCRDAGGAPRNLVELAWARGEAQTQRMSGPRFGTEVYEVNRHDLLPQPTPASALAKSTGWAGAALIAGVAVVVGFAALRKRGS